jgi:hypothetical protein
LELEYQILICWSILDSLRKCGESYFLNEAVFYRITFYISFTNIYMGYSTTHPPTIVKVYFSKEHLFVWTKNATFSSLKTNQGEGQLSNSEFN